MSIPQICPNCYAQIPAESTVCPHCNTPLSQTHEMPPQYNPSGHDTAAGPKYAPGADYSNGGYAPGGNVPPFYNYNQGYYDSNTYRQFMANDLFADSPEGKSRGLTALLALLLGTFGAHYFYLGKTTAGLIFLLTTILTCGILALIPATLSLIQFVILITMNNAEFRQRYVLSTSSIPF